jgi:hypothetical protein
VIVVPAVTPVPEITVPIVSIVDVMLETVNTVPAAGVPAALSIVPVNVAVAGVPSVTRINPLCPSLGFEGFINWRLPSIVTEKL